MNLKEIINDIFDDVNTTDQRYEDRQREMGAFMPRYRRHRASPGLMMLFLPQILGFVAGLAVTRLLGLSGIAYVIIGAIFAFAGGTYKSVSFDKISLRPALVRNALIMLLLSVIVAFVVLTD